jgi:hypothetical protein
MLLMTNLQIALRLSAPARSARADMGYQHRSPLSATAPPAVRARTPGSPIGAASDTKSRRKGSHNDRQPRTLISLIVFQNGHISGALAELIRSTRAPTKDPVDRQDHRRESCVSRHARSGPYARRADGLARARAQALTDGKCSDIAM